MEKAEADSLLMLGAYSALASSTYKHAGVIWSM